VTGPLDERRLREQAESPQPQLFSGIARQWVSALPDALARIRTAGPSDLPAALHELRSGAVAVGLAELPGTLAAIEQRAERGEPVDPMELDAALAQAERAAAALERWWASSSRTR
jgi:hypothetical protein